MESSREKKERGRGGTRSIYNGEAQGEKGAFGHGKKNELRSGTGSQKAKRKRPRQNREKKKKFRNNKKRKQPEKVFDWRKKNSLALPVKKTSANGKREGVHGFRERREIQTDKHLAGVGNRGNENRKTN